MNNSFDFKIITKKHKELFESLSDYNSNNNWTLKSPEMLIFHEWFDAKVKGVAYDHVEVMKRLKKNNRRA